MPQGCSDPVCAFAGVARLYSRYARAMDASDASGVSSLFVEDGIFEIAGVDRHQGRAALEEMVRATAEGRPLHTFANLLVSEPDSDGDVSCSSYFFIVSRETGQNLAYGVYDDLCTRDDDGRWMFRRRRVQVDWKSEAYASRNLSTRS